MRPRDRETLDRLAGDYVTGLLDGAARRRFQRWLADDEELRRLVADWDARLAPLLADAVPEAPPEAVWHGLERRLFGAEAAVAPMERVSAWYCLQVWRRFGLAAAALIVVLGVWIAVLAWPAPGDRGGQLAVLADNAGRAAWLARVGDDDAVTVENLGAPAPPGGTSYVLWLVPDGGAPVALGRLAPRAAPALPATVPVAPGAALAISAEPGGEIGPAPRGPVLFQGLLRAIAG